MPDLRQVARAAAGAAAALAAIAGVALASRLPVGVDPEHAELRLALRASGARLEICRDRSAEELERLPAHFRMARVCDEIPVDYRLTVAIDGAARVDRVVRHRGVRRTRPLAVDEAIEVAPGARAVAVRFAPIPPAGAGVGGVRTAVSDGESDDEIDDDENDERRRGDEEDDGGEDGEAADEAGSAVADAFAELVAAELATRIEFRAGRAELVVLDEDGRLERRETP